LEPWHISPNYYYLLLYYMVFIEMFSAFISTMKSFMLITSQTAHPLQQQFLAVVVLAITYLLRQL